ncbi:response regulator transcription factor [Exilibacterium tricleocarpae]|uniref:Response regulator transcription factor n=1 Tax=Exilibacterium tricleocarpae TaxID=2591008 RepID=A0A545SYB1_9GAMM|nr:response regulator transcription factor [Exilibacterium tricleocarpae]TQV69955.1 response regulator transcription factor [Exilibacterium tricleocarpae]
MSLSVIFWLTSSKNQMQDTLGSELSNAVNVIQASNSSEVIDLLEGHSEVDLVLVALKLTDIQVLHEIQQIQQRYPEIALLAFFNSMPRPAPTLTAAEVMTKPELGHLTPRQKEVLGCISDGKSNKQIARDLNLSEGTVKIHCMAIFRELGVSNRTQAALLAEHSMRH